MMEMGSFLMMIMRMRSMMSMMRIWMSRERERKCVFEKGGWGMEERVVIFSFFFFSSFFVRI